MVQNPTIPEHAQVVESSINQSLRELGIYCHEGKDEFDTVRLTHYRSNSNIFKEWELSQTG